MSAPVLTSLSPEAPQLGRRGLNDHTKPETELPFPHLGPSLVLVSISSPGEIPGLTEASARYSMWVRSPCCLGRKEQEGSQREGLLVLWASLPAL